MKTRELLLMSAAGLMVTVGVAEARGRRKVSKKPQMSVQAQIGMSGEAEGRVKGANTSDTEKLESDFGVMATIDWSIQPRFRLGVRLAYQSATGKDSEAGYTTADAGVWARYIIKGGKIQAFAAGGIGMTQMTLDPKSASEDFTGTGLQYTLGGGGSIPLGKMRGVGGVYYMSHAADIEATVGNNTATIEGALSGLYITAGIQF